MLDRILELPTAVRMALFGVIVVAVLALGWVALAPDKEEPATNDATTETSSTTGDDPIVVAQNPDDGNSAPEDDELVDDPTDGVELKLAMPVSDNELQRAAGRAVRFSELYLSYRPDMDVKDKNTELQRLMAEENTVDMAKVFPTGRVAQQLEANETVVAVKVTSVEAAMVSANIISLNVTVTTTTRTKNNDAEQVETVFAVAMSNDLARQGWYVSEFLSDDDPFLDEVIE